MTATNTGFEAAQRLATAAQRAYKFIDSFGAVHTCTSYEQYQDEVRQAREDYLACIG